MLNVNNHIREMLGSRIQGNIKENIWFSISTGASQH